MMLPPPARYGTERVAEILGQRQRRRVYFMRAEGGIGPVKIGCSLDPWRRVAELSIWTPFRLELLVDLPGGFDLERRFHALFADDLSHHEWFHWSYRMRVVVTAIEAGTFDLSTLPPPMPGNRARTAADRRAA